MRKRKILITMSALILSLSLVLSGCGGGGSGSPDVGDSGRAAENKLVVAIPTDVASLDPMAQNTTLTNLLGFHFFDTLFRTDPQTGKLTPYLADSYERVSDTEYVFKIKKGVLFQNGEELKANDVKFSLDRCMGSAGMASKFAMIDNVEVVDDYTVKINLKYPAYTLLNNLSTTAGVIMNEKYITENGDNFIPMGTGPYEFVEWKPGESITMKRNENYWGEKAAIEEIKLVVMTEDTSRTIALEAGDVDVNLNLATVDYAKIEANPDLQLVRDFANSVNYLGLSHKDPITSNLKVRQAIAHAIKKQDFVDVGLEGYGKTANSLIDDTTLGYYPDTPEYNYDVEKAKALLAEAGYPDGFDLTISIRFDSDNLKAQILQGQLQAIGINLKINRVENAVFLDMAKNAELQVFFGYWGAMTSDADSTMRALLYSKNGGTNNRSWYANEKMDQLIDNALAESDEAKRIETYRQAQVLCYEDCALIPVYIPQNAIAARANINGIIASRLGESDHIQMWKWSWE